MGACQGSITWVTAKALEFKGHTQELDTGLSAAYFMRQAPTEPGVSPRLCPYLSMETGLLVLMLDFTSKGDQASGSIAIIQNGTISVLSVFIPPVLF